ncbi:MAG: GNAT family N-acetyltransferase [Bacteriovorax sp.]|nr:GNAT family N-acetyltransferase [Bacteriovorax sp.]
MTIEIKIAELADVLDVVEHDICHMREPGFNGTYAHPFPMDYPWDEDKMRSDKILAWDKEIGEPGWARSFLLIENGNIVGHLNLKNLFDGTLHRAQLGMGFEQHARGKGYGKILLNHAVDWAKKQESLDWLDLSVFAHNTPARKLYTNAGFQELFTFPDRLRVEGTSIDDVYMVLKIK